MKRIAILLCAVFMAVVAIPSAYAIGVDPDMLEDPAQEARARQLMKDLRCLVCQNQSIENSNATLARDLRQIVRQRVAAGDSDAQVRAYLVDRYGEWVLMRPPMNTGTIVLWFGPGLLLTLWWKRTTKEGVWAGMMVGMITSIVWYNVSTLHNLLYELLPAFFLALITVWVVSVATSKNSS